VLGGDLSSGTMLSITVTALGRTSRPVSRVGAEPGDGIWVTGTLGGARAALEAFQAGREPDPAARSAFVRPPSRHAAGVWLGAHEVHAMLDLSDGLGADAPHLAAASGVAIVIDVERTPVSGPAAAAAVANGIEAALYAAVGGEDYELLAALPPEFENGGPAQFERETGLAITRVGEARRGRGVRFQLRGQKVTIDGFDHFR
jgi:thiamine-monophosphate kinase